ncbi:MAG: ATP-binding protein, partial [Planctomycetota bacterium]
KRNLCRDLRETLTTVVEAGESRRAQANLFEHMTSTQSQFSLAYDAAAQRAFVSYCQDALTMMGICGEALTLQIGMALHEALTNAVEHGNLELPSELREADDGSYEALREKRRQEPPYCDRRVYVEAFVSRSEARYVIRDEGHGFDPSLLPDPTDPENLLRSSGRGVLLMHAFMEDVTFNEKGNEVTLVKRRS